MVVVEYTKMVVEDTHRRCRGSILGDTVAVNWCSPGAAVDWCSPGVAVDWCSPGVVVSDLPLFIRRV